QALANEFMAAISNDLPSFIPLTAQRCAMAGWKPKAI
ncbi:MAG: SAM-dependent methyltransferase, partial [Nitrospina sp.]|nr:SAM-dependent methyltransferase [Nitrospina sp.]